MKDSERETVSILDRNFYAYIGEATAIMRRQLPTRLRRRYTFTVREWEGAPWVTVFRNLSDTGWAYHYDRHDIVASAALIDKPRRYKGKLVTQATMDPDLVAYLALVS